MIKHILLLTILLGTIVHCADEEVYNGPSEEDVIVLDADTLEPTIYESDEPWLLELYAPWCGHCKTLRPEWAKLATNLKGVVKVAKIDASIHRKFDQVYGLKGYPHVVFIPSGRKDKKIYYNYEGARSATALEEWALEKSRDAKGFLLERIVGEETWKEYCVGLQKPVCVIVFLPNLQDSTPSERDMYLNMAKETINNFRDKPISFLWTQAGDHPELQEQFAMGSGFPSVLLVSPTRKAYTFMKSSFTEENFEAFLKDVFGRKASRIKYGSYSGDLAFSNVDLSKEEEALNNSEVEIEVGEKEEEL